MGRASPQEKRRAPRGEEEKGCTIYFYEAEAFSGPGITHTARDKLSLLVHRILLGRGPLHCNIEKDGYIYDCSWQSDCTTRPAAYDPFQPTSTVELLDAKVDLTWFREGRRFQIVRTLLDVLRLLPAGQRPINCVHATARAVGIEERCRTPRDLLEVLRRCRIPLQAQPSR